MHNVLVFRRFILGFPDLFIKSSWLIFVINLVWMDIFNKPTDSKRYVLFPSNHPRRCLKNIPFCLARCICTTVEENTKLRRLSELKTSLKQQKYSIALTENSIKRTLQIPKNELRKPTEKGAE